MEGLKIYLVHPITGLSYDEVVGYYRQMRLSLEPHSYKILCPMTGKSYLRNEKEFKAHGYKLSPISTNHAIIERDLWMIEQADVVYADLSESKAVSIGCVMELAWAHLLRKHTIVLMEDDNVHRHAFVLETADIVFNEMEAALNYLKDLAHET